MWFLKNFRRGFATNSSSSHSFVYMKKPNTWFGPNPTTPEEYGWNDFRLDTVSEKLFYVLVSKLSNRFWNSTKTLEEKVQEAMEDLGDEFPEFTEETFEAAISDSYVDHQSVGTINSELARDPHVVVFGGNDNGEGSQERASAIRRGEVDWAITTPMFEDSEALETLQGDPHAINAMKYLER